MSRSSSTRSSSPLPPAAADTPKCAYGPCRNAAAAFDADGFCVMHSDPTTMDPRSCRASRRGAQARRPVVDQSEKDHGGNDRPFEQFVMCRSPACTRRATRIWCAAHADEGTLGAGAAPPGSPPVALWPFGFGGDGGSGSGSGSGSGGGSGIGGEIGSGSDSGHGAQGDDYRHMVGACEWEDEEEDEDEEIGRNPTHANERNTADAPAPDFALAPAEQRGKGSRKRPRQDGGGAREDGGGTTAGEGRRDGGRDGCPGCARKKKKQKKLKVLQENDNEGQEDPDTICKRIAKKRALENGHGGAAGTSGGNEGDDSPGESESKRQRRSNANDRTITPCPSSGLPRTPAAWPPRWSESGSTGPTPAEVNVDVEAKVKVKVVEKGRGAAKGRGGGRGACDGGGGDGGGGGDSGSTGAVATGEGRANRQLRGVVDGVGGGGRGVPGAEEKKLREEQQQEGQQQEGQQGRARGAATTRRKGVERAKARKGSKAYAQMFLGEWCGGGYDDVRRLWPSLEAWGTGAGAAGAGMDEQHPFHPSKFCRQVDDVHPTEDPPSKKIMETMLFAVKEEINPETAKEGAAATGPTAAAGGGGEGGASHDGAGGTGVAAAPGGGSGPALPDCLGRASRGLGGSDGSCAGGSGGGGGDDDGDGVTAGGLSIKLEAKSPLGDAEEDLERLRRRRDAVTNGEQGVDEWRVRAAEVVAMEDKVDEMRRDEGEDEEAGEAQEAAAPSGARSETPAEDPPDRKRKGRPRRRFGKGKAPAARGCGAAGTRRLEEEDGEEEDDGEGDLWRGAKRRKI